MQFVEIAAGAAIILAVFYDLFQGVILPRPAVGKIRLAPPVIRNVWRIWRWVGTRARGQGRRENLLAPFGPAALLILLGIWAVALTLGYALILDGLRDEIQPHPSDFATSIYFSATTMEPLSYGEIIPLGGWARFAIIAESATGVGLVALVISLLFSLYAAFQRREEAVVALDALAGAPPSGVQILENVAKYKMEDELVRTFDNWRGWASAVLESHLAYPILFYFRSSHDNEAWVNSFGAVMDAATLVLSTVDDGSEGSARLMFKVGNHLVEDTMWYFRFHPLSEPGVERPEFDAARARLAKAGYQVRDAEVAWADFVRLRSQYAAPLNQLALHLAIIPAQWIGDRSYLPHREARRAVSAPQQG